MTVRPLTRSERMIFVSTVSGFRMPASTQAGLQVAYEGRRASDGVAMANAVDLPASIQLQRGGDRNPPGLPTDGKRNQWFILIPDRFAPKGTFRNGDMLIDDLGGRFTVIGDYWGVMGYRLTCWKEEA